MVIPACVSVCIYTCSLVLCKAFVFSVCVCLCASPVSVGVYLHVCVFRALFLCVHRDVQIYAYKD